MRGVRLQKPCRPELVELPEPKAVPGEVRVRVWWAAVCATDRKLAQRGVEEPRVAGHEVAGVTEDGSVVGIHPDIPCGRCRQCALGWGNRCPARQAVGIDRDGGFAEWLVVPAAHAVPVPDVEPELIPLLEPLACCLQAATLLDVPARRRAVVVGGGPMGIIGTWALQALGAAVAVVDRNADRRGVARGLGADAVVAPDENPADALGGPVEAALVTGPGSEALAWALEHVEAGGALHAFAGSPGGAVLDANTVHYRHQQVIGGTGSRLTDYARAHALVASGALDLGRLPRKVITLDALPSALSARPARVPERILVKIGGDAR